MKAIVLEEPKRFSRLELAEAADLAPGEVLVGTHRMGICGTDVSGYLGKMPFLKYPRILGHELGVEVLETSDGVSNLGVGDRCSVEPYMNCGHCFACRRGNSNCCERLKVLGVMVDGGLRERLVLPAHKLHKSAVLSYEQLALVETLAIGCHATDRGGPRKGDQVLIIGAGPIGLAVLEFTRLTNAEITVMDMNRARLDFCKTTYDVAHTVVFENDGSEVERMQELTDGAMYAIVTDATGSVRSMNNALNYVAHTGRLVYVGIVTDQIRFPHPLLHKREMSLAGSRNALPTDFRRIIELIEEGTVSTDSWITHRTAFADFIGNFDSYTKPDTGVIKAIVEVT